MQPSIRKITTKIKKAYYTLLRFTNEKNLK